MNDLKISDFHTGQVVWISGIKFYPSGRVQYNLRPTKARIDFVGENNIKISVDYWGVPNTYYTYGSIHDSIKDNIALSQERSIENYNNVLKSEIESHYQKYQSFESMAKRYLI